MSQPTPAPSQAPQPVLYGHPFSSYTQKVLIALYENATPFEFRVLGPDAPQHAAQWLAKWPLRQFPLLVDGARDVVETSIIIEYLQPRACLRSFRGRASTLPGWDARRGARLIARLSTSAATPQTARQGSCPRVGAKSGDWTPRLLAWARAHAAHPKHPLIPIAPQRDPEKTANRLFDPGPVRLIPSDPVEALDVRFMDRFFDLHVMNAMQLAVNGALTGDAIKRKDGMALAVEKLDRAYAWLEGRLAGRTWACGEHFTLADCAAAPSLFYADWTHPIPETCPVLRAYRARLLARPSFARAVEEARYFRPHFPLGAPDRD